MLSEISQTEKDKYCIFLPYMWNLKTNAINITKQEQTHRYRVKNCQKGRRGEAIVQTR